MEGVEAAPHRGFRSRRSAERLDAENGLLHAVAEQWLRYANARVDTTHDYDGEKARACLEIVLDFVEDPARLYQTMTGETWE